MRPRSFLFWTWTDATRPDPEVPFWILRPNREEELALLEWVLDTFEEPYFHCFEDLAGWDDEHMWNWRRLDARTAVLPADADAARLYDDWLYPGGWSIYVSDEVLDEEVLLFIGESPSPRQVVRHLDVAGAAFLLDAALDCVSYRVAITSKVEW